MNWSQFSDRFACFACRKAFKPRKGFSVVSRCPQCGGPVANMGMDFRPPKRTNVEAWAALEVNPKPFYGGGCRPPCCPRGGSAPKAVRKENERRFRAAQGAHEEKRKRDTARANRKRIGR